MLGLDSAGKVSLARFITFSQRPNTTLDNYSVQAAGVYEMHAVGLTDFSQITDRRGRLNDSEYVSYACFKLSHSFDRVFSYWVQR